MFNTLQHLKRVHEDVKLEKFFSILLVILYNLCILQTLLFGASVKKYIQNANI